LIYVPIYRIVKLACVITSPNCSKKQNIPYRRMESVEYIFTLSQLHQQ